MKKTFMFATLAIAGIATTTATFAYQGKMGTNQIDATTRNAITQAVQNQNYSAFQSAVSNLEVFPNMTEEKFNEITQKRINNMRNERRENYEQVMATIESEDYEAWKTIAHEDMVKAIDSEAKFAQLIEMHTHMNAAEKIRESLGLPNDKFMLQEKNSLNHPMGNYKGNNKGFGMHK